MQPVRLSSRREFRRLFGGPKIEAIDICVEEDSAGAYIVTGFTEPALDYLLYQSLRLFFANGGDQCYVISVGTYQLNPMIDLTGDGGGNPATAYGLDRLAQANEPTLIVIPEALKLSAPGYQKHQ
jgi:hypothetical protein